MLQRGDFSSISEFPAEPSAKPKPRPRPRPRAVDPDSTIEGFSTLPLGPDDISEVLSIADRAKTRQRTTVSSHIDDESFILPPPTKRRAASSSELIELTSDEDNYAPRSTVKSKQKPKPKPKAKEAPPPPPESPIRKTSDVPKPKPRPRPRPRVVQPPSADLSAIQSDSPRSSSAHGIPLPTSSPRAPVPHSNSPSSLPRIAILGGTSGSLFTDDEDIPPKSLDNPIASSQPEFDELEPLPFWKTAASPSRLSPPPTFFASSPACLSSKEPVHLPDEPRQVVDLTAPRPSPSSVELPATKKPKKTKNGRRKLTDITVVEEDNGEDGDFDPSTAKPKKQKPKPPKNKKEPTSAELPGQVEVVITKKPPGSRGRGKEKEKDPTLFKSAEFIDDDDDEDPMRLRPQPSVDHDIVHPGRQLTFDEASKLPSNPASPGPSPSNPPVPPFEAPKVSRGNAKSKKRKVFSDESDLSSEEAAPAPKKSKGKAAEKGKGKGKEKASSKAAKDEDVFAETVEKVQSKTRRRVVDSEDEGAEDVQLSPGLIAEPSKIAGNDRSGRSTKTGDPHSVQGSNEKMNVDINESNEVEEVLPKVVLIEPSSVVDTYSLSQENIPSRAQSIRSEGTPGPNTPLYTRYEVAPRRPSVPMSELIRRMNSKAGSPFAASPMVAKRPSISTPSSSTRSPAARIYSPYLKSSRTMLSKIAPLHMNRRTPPPPPPPPPPRKKTKKELELEEQWEEELIESVGGSSEWSMLSDEQKKTLKKQKWAKEMGNCSD